MHYTGGHHFIIATKMAGTGVSFHLLGRTAPMDAAAVVLDDTEDERADLSFSSLSSLNAFRSTSCRSWNLLFFSMDVDVDADVSLPREASSFSSSMIWSSTFEHRGKKRFPSSTGTPSHLVSFSIVVLLSDPHRYYYYYYVANRGQILQFQMTAAKCAYSHQLSFSRSEKGKAPVFHRLIHSI